MSAHAKPDDRVFPGHCNINIAYNCTFTTKSIMMVTTRLLHFMKSTSGYCYVAANVTEARR